MLNLLYHTSLKIDILSANYTRDKVCLVCKVHNQGVP